MARPEKRNLKYYLAELIILVLGISLSFVLNEYRQQQRELKKEGDLLESFRDNLILDSLSLHIQLQAQEVRMKTAQKLLELSPDSEFTDSLTYHVIILQNYGGFYPTDITYQEMRSQGTSRLIQNTELLNEIIQLYESDYDLVAEWTGLDKTFMTTELLPYTHEHFPFARQFQYHRMSDKKKRQMINVLTTDQMKNLIQNSEITLLGSKVFFKQAQGEVRRILGMLNEELKEESELGVMAKQQFDSAVQAQDSLKALQGN